MELYEYRARILRVIDGDTVQLDVDLGFDVRQRMTVRLYGINAPEMNTPEGKVAKMHLAMLILEGMELELHTLKDKREKYGRYLAVLMLRVPGTDGRTNVNQMMVEDGHAVPYMV